MKKFLCLVMSLVLVMTAVSAFAAVEYTLEEKWQRQVDFGNGIKGTLNVHVEGEKDWAQLLAPLSDVPLEIRAIHSDKAFQYRIYAENGEDALGLTQLYGDDKAVYLHSELMPDMLLSLTTDGDVLDRVSGNQQGMTPTLYSAMLNIMNVPETTWEGKWQPALDAYETAIELWLESYASAPSVKRDAEGGATVLVRYDIPAEAVKAQIKALWGNILVDETLQPLLRGQMNQEQQDIYFNEHVKYYFDQIIDSLSLEGNIVLEREMTAKGEALRTDMSFPLDYEGWTSLTVKQLEKTTEVVLTGEGKSLEVELEETAATSGSVGYKGKLRYVPGQEKESLGVGFTLVEVKSSSADEDTRSHNVTNWTLKVQPDEACSGQGWKAVEPMELTTRVHIHSKAMQYNPVTLEIETSVKMADAQLSAALELRTSSPWVLDALPTEGARDAASLTEEERGQLFTDLGLNALTVLQMVKESAAEVATATDLEAAQ